MGSCGKCLNCTCQTETVTPQNVHQIIGEHMLADGFNLVLDLDKSYGHHLHDSKTGRTFLDMFSCFATLPIGFNHPKMFEPTFRKKMDRVARNNPTNSDVYTLEMAEFVQTWTRLAMPLYFSHLFFVSGGALAVENALKTAIDWKVRRTFRIHHAAEFGHQIIHFRGAFHGRSGYTLSLTNTADPRKYLYFPKFLWPRVTHVPAIQFPLDEEEYARLKEVEELAIEQIKAMFIAQRGDISAIIIEPIQGEGGDNHFRPEFLRALRQLADENEVFLIFDEIQTGMGLTGRMWAHEHFDVQPDILVFGKKTQVCGIMVGPKVDQEPDNVFSVSSRINSTWGGSLVDMVRCQRYLEIMEEEQLVLMAGIHGEHLSHQLRQLQATRPDMITNARGRGLMCAVDLPTAEIRNQVVDRCYDNSMIILPSGERSIRFRPSLDISVPEIDQAVNILEKSLVA